VKLWKLTVSFVMSVCHSASLSFLPVLSVLKNSAPKWTDFVFTKKGDFVLCEALARADKWNMWQIPYCFLRYIQMKLELNSVFHWIMK
jgi:hypothetical protein